MPLPRQRADATAIRLVDTRRPDTEDSSELLALVCIGLGGLVASAFVFLRIWGLPLGG